MELRRIQPTPSNPRITVLVITAGFAIIFLLTNAYWALWIGLVVGVLGGLSGFLARKIEWAWMKLAWLLSFVVPKILLTAIFFLVLCPLAGLSRTFGTRDPLLLQNNSKSTFKSVDKVFDAESLENPW